MADIFISYSRKDSKQAISLAERLRAAGMDVWIDQHGLEAATSWSKEIVEAIESSQVFIILLSRSSLLSENVVKELSIASEAHRTILPIDLEAVTIPSDFKYQLAGLQRAQYSDFDSIVRALEKIGIAPSSDSSTPGANVSRGHGSAPARPRRKRMPMLVLSIIVLAIGASTYFIFFAKQKTPSQTGLKTLAVLPFESLSSDKDNEYFADGMTSTLIDMLLPIPELKVVDRMSIMGYKSGKRDMKSIASELGVRYLVDGTIEKQGNRIKISMHLTDARTDSILLSKNFEGNTNDLMSMQEQVARSIVYELQLAFNPSGVVMPPEAVSAVPEASSLGEMGSAVPMNSAASIRVAISYYLKAVQLDTGYAFAYLNIARSYGNIYPYDHSDSILSLADSFFAIGKRFDTAGVFYHFVASWLATQHRDFETAIREAKIYLQKRPQDARGYRVLGLAYHAEGKLDLAVLNFEEDLKRNPLNMGEMGTIYDDLYRSGDTASLKRFATQVLPLFESAVMRNPENRELESRYIWMLFASGRGDEAGRRMDNFIKPPFDNPNGMEDAVELFAMNKNTVHAMELLRDVVKRINIADTNSWNLNEKELVNLRPLPEFQELLKHQKEAVAKKNGL